MSDSSKSSSDRRIRRIRAAENRLDAFRTDNGMWAYWAEEVDEAYYVTCEEILFLGLMLEDGQPDAYSEWCATCKRRRMSPRTVRKYFDMPDRRARKA